MDAAQVQERDKGSTAQQRTTGGCFTGVSNRLCVCDRGRNIRRASCTAILPDPPPPPPPPPPTSTATTFSTWRLGACDLLACNTLSLFLHCSSRRHYRRRRQQPAIDVGHSPPRESRLILKARAAPRDPGKANTPSTRP
ncbi:hypothetical protein C0Q70_04674 [Pomacea canaliculata]|uniref:Uncharacterized protein n=1 Tax=Pomacea canaliculata TaxID=400727 RepID=A0A2T7PJ18_POMCA|nr:hypothetical protein C0Q70_04674 [Pomacea canaliculata]